MNNNFFEFYHIGGFPGFKKGVFVKSVFKNYYLA
jgi:hypothetical protein